jgi:hypothetical protein
MSTCENTTMMVRIGEESYLKQKQGTRIFEDETATDLGKHDDRAGVLAKKHLGTWCGERPSLRQPPDNWRNSRPLPHPRSWTPR